MFEFFRRHKVWRAVATAVLALLLIAAALPIGVVVLLNPQITRYVESEAFRAELEKERPRDCISRADITNRSNGPGRGQGKAPGLRRTTAGKP